MNSIFLFCVPDRQPIQLDWGLLVLVRNSSNAVTVQIQKELANASAKTQNATLLLL